MTRFLEIRVGWTNQWLKWMAKRNVTGYVLWQNLAVVKIQPWPA